MRKLFIITIITFASLLIIPPLLLLIQLYFIPEVEWLPRPTLARGWSTPEEAVQQTLGQGIEPWKPVPNPMILASFPINRGRVLLYVGQTSSDSATPAIGLGSVKQGWRGWYLTGQMDLQSATLTNTSQSTNFDSITQPFSQKHYLIVTGRARNADVKEVQAIFDTGRMLRSKLYGQSFVMMEEGANGICSLRTLNANGVEIEKLVWPKCQNNQPFSIP